MGREVLQLKFIPRVYQHRFIQDLLDDPFHGGFMDPGLGKTAAMLLAMKEAGALPALVIAPLNVCHLTWPDEVEKWDSFSDLRTSILHGRHKSKALKEDADLYLINPEGLPWLFGKRSDDRKKWVPGKWKNWLDRPPTLIVDESTKFKRASGTRAKTLKRFLMDFARRHILTGTPVPNGMLDLHGQLLILDRGKSLDHRVTYYQKKYFDAVPVRGRRHRVKYDIKDGAFDAILEAIRPRITTLRAEDWLELPELITTSVPVILPPNARKLYNEMKEHGTIEALDVLADQDSALNKCRQISNGAIYLPDGRVHQIHSAKDDAIIELIEQIGAPVMILYEFLHDLERIKKKLSHLRIGQIGKNGANATKKAVKDWNTGKLDVLITHPQSGGIGLNLQDGGAHQIWYTPPWDLEHYQQTVKRLHRQGQERSVMIYHLVGRNTFDSRVMRVLSTKGATQDDMMNALKEEIGWLEE